MRLFRNTVTRIIGMFLLLILAGMFAVQNPKVQKAIADAALEKINSSFEGTFKVGEIKILPFSAFSISDVVLLDKNPYTEDIYHKGFPPADTVARIKNITGTFSLIGLLSRKGIHLGNLYIDGAFMHLVIEPDGDGNHQANIKRLLNNQRKESRKKESGDIFDIRRLTVRNARYKMQSFVDTKPHANKGVNYHDMDAVTDFSASSIRYTKSRMFATMDWCTIREKNGCFIKNITGSCKVGMGQTAISDLHITDNWSDLRLDKFVMTYKNPEGLSKFVEKTRMEVVFSPGTLSGRTISALTDHLFKNDLLFNIRKGRINGYVNDFRIDELVFSEEKSGVSGNLDGYCLGLPDFRDLMMDVSVRKMKFTVGGLGRFADAFSSRKEINLYRFGQGKRYSADLHLCGPANKLKVEAAISHRKELLEIDSELRNLMDKERKFEAAFLINSENFNLGTVTGTKGLGQASIHFKGFAKADGKNSVLRVDSLGIRKLNFNGYDYGTASIKGHYSKGNADLRFVSLDPEFDFKAALKSSVNKDNGNTHTVINLSGARINLAAMNIDRRGGQSSLSLEASADLMQMGDGDFIGEADIHNVVAVSDRGIHNIGDLTANIHMSDRQSRILLNSAPLDLDYHGCGKPSELVKRLRDAVVKGPDAEKPVKDGEYKIEARFHDTREILSFLKPELYISDGTDISVRYDSHLSAQIFSDRAAFRKNYIKGLDARIEETGGALTATVKGDEICAASYRLCNFQTLAKTDSNRFELQLGFTGEEEDSTDGALLMRGEISSDENNRVMVRSNCDSSRIRLKGCRWDILPFSMVYCNKELEVDSFCLASDFGRLNLDGRWSKRNVDTLRMTLDDFRLDIIDRLSDGKFEYGGHANATAMLVSGPEGVEDLAVNMSCDSIMVGGKSSGALCLDGSWDKEAKAILADCKQYHRNRETLKLSASYATKAKSLSAALNLDSLDLTFCAPLFKSLSQKLNGSVSGDVSIQGPLKNLNVTSNGVTLNNVELLLTGTGANYFLDGPIRAGNDGIHLDGLSIRDNENGTGSISGSIVFKNLQDCRLESSIKFDNLLFLNNSSNPEKTVYGKIKASGEGSLNGALDNLVLTANLGINEVGEVHVPLSNALVGAKSDVLTFKKPENETDPYVEMLERLSTGEKKKNNIALNVDLSIGKGFKIYGEFDSSTGHCAMVEGEGRAILKLQPAKDKFDVTGEYAISGGNYHFVLPGILDKNFTVNPGSEVKFNGNVMNSDLNILASRTVKANLNTLVADSSSVATRRPVICGISITDKLKNPNIGFSIEVPDLEPNIRSQVETALNTEAKVQKQFISLLLFGTFIPAEQSGVFNTSSVLYSNVSEVMSSQLSSILQKLDIPVDLGIGYQQNTNGGAGMFDVAVSTQLFNNRVIVGGSIGNKQYNKSGNSNTVAGDIDIEIKLDREGQFRVNLFSHSADAYTSYLDNSQRSGVGISFQKEYSKFGEALKNIFKRSTKKVGSKEKEVVVISVPPLSEPHH